MKWFFTVLLCAMLLIGGTAAAEASDGYTTLTSMDGFYGIWSCCASNDSLPYLVLHADQTYEAYDWWQIDTETTTGDALRAYGTYTFDPADGTFTMEGSQTAYILKTAYAEEGMESGSGEVEGTPDKAMLLLYDPTPMDEDEFGDNSMLYLPTLPEEISLLPTAELLYEDECCWVESAAFAYPGNGTPIWTFYADGTATWGTRDEVVEKATYVYDNGRLTMTFADGTVKRLLMQCAYIPLLDTEEESAEQYGDMFGLFDIDNEDDYGNGTIISHSLLLVRDLDAQTASYFFLSAR